MSEAPFMLKIEMSASSKKAMRQKLLEIVAEFDSDYGKPCQGIYSQHLILTRIQTPIWDNKPY